MVHFENFTHLSFDCYGTLIDWQTAQTPGSQAHDSGGFCVGVMPQQRSKHAWQVVN